ncbi:extracellular solute-binding protein [Natrialbaceae archaeon A-CW3]
MSENGSNQSTRSSVSRRTFVAAAGASGVSVGLAGCIYGNGDDGEGTVTFGFDPDAANQVGEEIQDLYYGNGLSEDIEIEFRPGADNTDERRDNYQTALDTGEEEPDLMLMDNGWVNVFIQQGLIANLNEQLDDDHLQTVEDDYFEGFTATARDPETDDLYGVPLFPDFPVMIYRKDYAREAGYDDDDFEEWETEPITWEEWSHLAEEVVDASDANFGLATQWDVYEGTSCCTFNEVLSSWGGAYFGGPDDLFGPVGERDVTVDEPEFVDSLRMMRTFVDEDYDDALDDYASGVAPSDITSWTEDESLPEFENGNAAFHRNWPYAIRIAAEEYGTDDIGTMPIPYAVTEDEANQPGTGGTTSALGGWHIVLNPNSNNLEEASEVLQVSMEDDFLLGILEVWGWLPPKPELFESEEAENIEPMGEYMDTLRIGGENTMPRPVTEVWGTQSTRIAEEANAAVSGSKEPDEAAGDLQEALEDIEEG